LNPLIGSGENRLVCRGVAKFEVTTALQAAQIAILILGNDPKYAGIY
jgi:hypothetical protein